MNVVLERGDVRYTYNGVLENGVKDYRMQLKDEYTKRWGDVYYFDNEMQCDIAIEDQDYTNWLLHRPCYIKDDEE
jgi:hypothetical protein